MLAFELLLYSIHGWTLLRASEDKAYRERGLERVSAFLPHSERGTAGQAAQLSPHTLPLERVSGHPQGELHRNRGREPFP